MQAHALSWTTKCRQRVNPDIITISLGMSTVLRCVCNCKTLLCFIDKLCQTINVYDSTNSKALLIENVK